MDIADKDDEQAEGGQVSEVSGMQEAGEPITPGDSVAGHPHDQGDDSVAEGSTGPEAPTGNQDTDRDPQ